MQYAFVITSAATLLGFAFASPIDYVEPISQITPAPIYPHPTPTSDAYSTCTPGVTLCIDDLSCGRRWGG